MEETPRLAVSCKGFGQLVKIFAEKRHAASLYITWFFHRRYYDRRRSGSGIGFLEVRSLDLSE